MGWMGLAGGPCLRTEDRRHRTEEAGFAKRKIAAFFVVRDAGNDPFAYSA